MRKQVGGIVVAAVVVAVIGAFVLDVWLRAGGAERVAAESQAIAVSSISLEGDGAPRKKTSAYAAAWAVQSVAPLLASREKLEARGLSGDADAAAELAHLALHCYTSVSAVLALQIAIKNAQTETRELVITRHAADWPLLPERLADVQRRETRECRGLDRIELAKFTRSITRQAALLGDVDAQLCAIEGYFLTPRAQGLTKQEVENGVSLSQEFEQRALTRGDWRIVQLMLLRARTVGHGSIGSHLLSKPTDPETYYRSLLLLRLGADEPYASDLDDEIRTFLESNRSMPDEDAIVLSDEQLLEADRWAHAQAESHFGGSARMTSAPIPCGDY